ncbi:MAG: barstar family protein [Lachnospiraceae bacterium]|nr:barstar family protein [Lachnospiraceae bacterium]
MNVILDARKMTERTEAHKYLKESFSMPDYYGHNLDALFDCLTDLDATDITVTHLESDNAYAMRVLRVLRDAAVANRRLHLTVESPEVNTEPPVTGEEAMEVRAEKEENSFVWAREQADKGVPVTQYMEYLIPDAPKPAPKAPVDPAPSKAEREETGQAEK